MLWWEKLPGSPEGSLERELELSRQAALFPLGLLPHREEGWRHEASVQGSLRKGLAALLGQAGV